MKAADVKVGMLAYTNIGAELTAVEVVAEVPGTPSSAASSLRRGGYRVKRIGATEWLPKLRPASALRLENPRALTRIFLRRPSNTT